MQILIHFYYNQPRSLNVLCKGCTVLRIMLSIDVLFNFKVAPVLLLLLLLFVYPFLPPPQEYSRGGIATESVAIERWNCYFRKGKRLRYVFYVSRTGTLGIDVVTVDSGGWVFGETWRRRGRTLSTAAMEILCCLSEEAKLQRKVNDEIEKQLTRDKTEQGR